MESLCYQPGIGGGGDWKQRMSGDLNLYTHNTSSLFIGLFPRLNCWPPLRAVQHPKPYPFRLFIGTGVHPVFDDFYMYIHLPDDSRRSTQPNGIRIHSSIHPPIYLSIHNPPSIHPSIYRTSVYDQRSIRRALRIFRRT